MEDYPVEELPPLTDSNFADCLSLLEEDIENWNNGHTLKTDIEERPLS